MKMFSDLNLYSSFSVFIFRLGNEWLAIPTHFLKEVTSQRPHHTVPHRSNKVFIGLVNLTGKLELYASLHELLSIPSIHSAHTHQQNRLIAIEKEGELWIFPVDEIDGVYTWNMALLEKAPFTPSQLFHSYIKVIVNLSDKRVSLIDDELLFSSLHRSLL